MDDTQLKTLLEVVNADKPVGDWSDKPAIAATTVAVENESPWVMWVEVTGGTVSAVAVGGTSVGRTSGAFLVRPGDSITLTYSAAPTWKWFAL